MSNLELIDRLCQLLAEALDMLRKQSELLGMHGIETDDGSLEQKRTQLLADIEKSI